MGEELEANGAIYIPVQNPYINICSVCGPTFVGDRGLVAFYIFPCGKNHLAHSHCFKEFIKKQEEGCMCCIKEFGTPEPVEQKREYLGFNMCRGFFVITLFIFIGILIWFSIRFGGH